MKLKLVPDDTNINFVGMRFVAFIFSVLVVVGSIFLVTTKGLNFGIDFTGGTVIEVRVSEIPDTGALRTELNELDLGGVSLQEFGEPNDLMIRLPQQPETEEMRDARMACLADHSQSSDSCPKSPQQLAIEKVSSALDAKFGEGNVEYRRTEYVGPQVGEELKKAGGLAILWSLVGILAYIWFRFEWQFGVAAIVALVHDAVATIGFFALTQMQFDLSTVAAVLMIAGYSINDTVVVFDRVRENMRKYKKKPLPELFNLSVNQMLSRTLMTSLTTLLALFALYIFGGEVIRGFVDALIFGIAIGTYSSIFVASPVLIYLNVRRGDVVDENSQEVAEQAN